MMVLVFATMFLTMVFGWFGRRSIAAVFLIACIVLSLGEFMWEIYSPDYGFDMPWIQTDVGPALPTWVG